MVDIDTSGPEVEVNLEEDKKVEEPKETIQVEETEPKEEIKVEQESEVKEETEDMYFVKSLNGQYFTWIHKQNSDHWKIVK